MDTTTTTSRETIRNSPYWSNQWDNYNATTEQAVKELLAMGYEINGAGTPTQFKALTGWEQDDSGYRSRNLDYAKSYSGSRPVLEVITYLPTAAETRKEEQKQELKALQAEKSKKEWEAKKNERDLKNTKRSQELSAITGALITIDEYHVRIAYPDGTMVDTFAAHGATDELITEKGKLKKEAYEKVIGSKREALEVAQLTEDFLILAKNKKKLGVAKKAIKTILDKTWDKNLTTKKQYETLVDMVQI